ncbi:MAG: hypothetical protein HFJ17_04445 [Clostridia bacterium]|nr:hypothetical protein [Clostridia bacterium]
MKSICIKTNNQKAINYLLDGLNNIEIDNIYFSCKKFKNYQNIIVHFTGTRETIFFKELSYILSNLVIDIYEDEIINKLISNDYFYFDLLERKQIAELTFEDSYDQEEAEVPKYEVFDLLCRIFYNYISTHHSIVLKGFITFRIRDYIEILNKQIDKSVNKFLIQREYNEFVSLLKMYINTEKSKTDIIHLIYSESNPVLLDKSKNIIKIDQNMFNAKYLSDITFSSSDYALNTLLTLLPKRIYIHLIDNSIDEFITTLKLIFEDRVVYCTDCSICKTYKNKKNHALI